MKQQKELMIILSKAEANSVLTALTDMEARQQAEAQTFEGTRARDYAKKCADDWMILRNKVKEQIIAQKGLF